MEPERIIEFLLREAQFSSERMSRAEQRMDRSDERMDRLEETMARANARMDRFERQLRVMTRLGRRAFATLSEQQRETNTRLDAVILLLERHLGGDGTAPA